MDNRSIAAMMITVCAGLSTIIGAFIMFFTDNKKKNTLLLTVAVGFAAGVMISVGMTDLLPDARTFLITSKGKIKGTIMVAVFFSLGLAISFGIDRISGHLSKHDDINAGNNVELMRTGMISALGLALHNFPEGIATFIAGYKDIKLGILIGIAIILHSIPEGMSISIPIYYATGNKKKALKYVIIAGLTEPFGALLSFLFLRPILTETVLGCAFALISGIMLYIAFEELIPDSGKYGHNISAFVSIFVGIILMPLTHMLMK